MQQTQDIFNTKYNRQLLIKYLIKFYGKQKAKQILEKHKSNLWEPGGVAYSLGKRSVEYFCLMFLQDIFVPKPTNTARNLAQVHFDIWNELEQMFIEDKWDKEEFILCRGVSKSTVINKALSCYLHCYKKSRYTIVLGNKEADAQQFIEDTRQMLENQYIQYTFGKLIDTKTRTVNKNEIELTNNTKIQAFSWGSSVRGTTYGCIDGIFRPSCVICDDVLSEDDILSDNAKEKVINKFYKEVLEVGDEVVIRNGQKIKSATKFIVIGTPLAQDCFINTVKKDVIFKIFHRRVVDFDIDEYFESNEYWQKYRTILFDNKIDKEDRDRILKELYLRNIEYMSFPTIWEKYECNKLAEKYFNNRTAFMQELMCDCQNIGEKKFKSNRVESPEEIESHTFTKTMLCCDPAGTRNKGKKKDYYAFLVGSLSDNDFKYVRKGQIFKFEYEDYINHVINLLKDYKDVSAVYIEKNVYSGSDVLKLQELISKDNILKNRNLTWINEHQNKNKDDKIQTIVGDVNNGRIIFNSEDEDFIQQIMNFQGCAYSSHDDAPDITAEFANRIESIETIKYATAFDKSKLGL